MVTSSSSSLSRTAIKFAPHASMIFVQASTGGYVVLSKLMLIQSTSSTVFNFYQLVVSTIFMTTLALVYEREERPPLTRSVLFRIFLLALVGMTVSMNLLSASLYFITSTIEAAIFNMMPVFTFILSILSIQEKLSIDTLWGKGKIFGTLLSVTGALTLILWHGPVVDLLHSTSLVDWLLGLVMVVFGVLALSTWILLLRPMTIIYPAEISLNALMLFFATLQTAVLASATSHKASQWQLRWDLELLNIFVGAIFYSGLSNLFSTWSAAIKGPIFVATFSPLGLVFTTILETLFLGQSLDLGSVVGIVLAIVGLYIFLLSKAKEEDCCYCLLEGDDSPSLPLVS